ncbi:MAG: outer membrane beta-barrel protein [Woeseiaceae bacterium]|nr:outer membrane beta-barrel protein [Woeseiaceae bacterium]
MPYHDINLDFDEDDFSWSAFAGIQATDTLAVEASYNNFGDFDTSRTFDLTQTDIDAELTGYDVMGVLSLPMGPLRLYGKAGVVYWDARATARIQPPFGSGFSVDDDDNGTDLAFGGGLEFRISPALSLRGELEWFDIEDTEEVWFASAGIAYRF